MSAVLVALSVGCGADSNPAPTLAPVPPNTPTTPTAPTTQSVEVTTVTTGVRLDPDGYGILNDEWDYDVGDGVTVAAPTNGTAILYLRPGSHVLSVVGVAKNGSGENLDDRPVTVQLGAVARVLFQLTCKES